MSANFVSNTAILCWLGTSFHFCCFILFYFFSMFPDHMPLGVSSMKLPPVPTGLFYRSLLHQHCTKQHESSVGLQNHQTRSDWLFFFILLRGAGTSLQCRDSVTCKRGDVVKLQQNFWTQLVLCENLRGSWRHPS